MRFPQRLRGPIGGSVGYHDHASLRPPLCLLLGISPAIVSPMKNKQRDPKAALRQF